MGTAGLPRARPCGCVQYLGRRSAAAHAQRLLGSLACSVRVVVYCSWPHSDLSGKSSSVVWLHAQDGWHAHGHSETPALEPSVGSGHVSSPPCRRGLKSPPSHGCSASNSFPGFMEGSTQMRSFRNWALSVLHASRPSRRRSSTSLSLRAWLAHRSEKRPTRPLATKLCHATPSPRGTTGSPTPCRPRNTSSTWAAIACRRASSLGLQKFWSCSVQTRVWQYMVLGSSGCRTAFSHARSSHSSTEAGL